MVKKLRRLGMVILGALVSGYLLLCVLLFAAQRPLIFPAPRSLMSVRDGSTRVEVPNGTYFLYREAPGEGAVVVHFHGNGEQVSNLSWLAQSWVREGVSFVAVEYPGYPGTQGGPSEAAFFDAAEAALVHLTRVLHVDRSRLVLEGQSIGTGVAVAMAARGWGRRLVLLSPYTSLFDVAARAFPGFPVRLLLRDPFRSIDRIAGVKAPLLVLHGDQDQTVPFAEGERLFAAAPQPKRFVRIPGGAHMGNLEDPRGLAAVRNVLDAVAAGRAAQFSSGDQAGSEP